MKETPLSALTACTFFSNAHFRHSLLEAEWAPEQFTHFG